MGIGDWLSFSCVCSSHTVPLTFRMLSSACKFEGSGGRHGGPTLPLSHVAMWSCMAYHIRAWTCMECACSRFRAWWMSRCVIGSQTSVSSWGVELTGQLHRALCMTYKNILQAHQTHRAEPSVQQQPGKILLSCSPSTASLIFNHTK